MAPFTEIVAAVVVHSSAVALSHFGVVAEPTRAEAPPTAERVIARSPRKAAVRPSQTPQKAAPDKA